MNSATAIVPQSYEGMRMVVAPAEARQRIQELQAFVKAAMVKGEDYGVIPGTDKPTMYQQGAQKLAEIYGLAHHFEIIESVKDWERGFFYFEYRCVLNLRRDGSHVGDGIGSCNSRESKYGARWAFDNQVPEGLPLASLKTKEITSSKGPNKGKKFTMYQVPNPDPYSIVNTLQKMACKRAYVHAVIAATRSSGLFTQDLEDQDIPDEAFGEAESVRSWDQTDPEDATAAIATKLRSSITACKTVDELRTAWGGVGVAFRSKWITEEQKNELVSLRDARIVELGGTPPATATAAHASPASASPTPPASPAPAKPPSAPPPAPGPAKADPTQEPCVFCKNPVGPLGVEHTDREGVIHQRHEDCTAFEHRGNRKP